MYWLQLRKGFLLAMNIYWPSATGCCWNLTGHLQAEFPPKPPGGLFDPPGLGSPGWGWIPMDGWEHVQEKRWVFSHGLYGVFHGFSCRFSGKNQSIGMNGLPDCQENDEKNHGSSDLTRWKLEVLMLEMTPSAAHLRLTRIRETLGCGKKKNVSSTQSRNCAKGNLEGNCFSTVSTTILEINDFVWGNHSCRWEVSTCIFFLCQLFVSTLNTGTRLIPWRCEFSVVRIRGGGGDKVVL